MRSNSILHITGQKCTKYGAIERYLLHTAKYCQQHGYETILQYETLPYPQAYLEDLDKVGVKLIIRPVNDNILFGLFGLATLMAKVRPNIVHAHFVNGVGTLAIPILARLFGASRAICTVHNKSSDPRRWIKTTGYNLYDHVLCVSEAVRETLLAGEVKEHKLRTHYLGIFDRYEKHLPQRYEIRDKYGIPQDAILLACIAFDAYFKGWDIFLRAFSEVAKINKRVFLMSVGVNPAESELPALAQRLEISDKICWAGIVDDGWLLLNATDIYVQPSRSSEGLPLSIMEAMALKLPVVCTNVSGNVEAVVHEDSGLVVEPNADSLANGILSMIENRGRWKSMGEIAHQRFLKLFNGVSSIQRMVDEYYLSNKEDVSKH